MHKEVMKPRSYKLENTALVAAILSFAVWLCSGCGIESVPTPGTWRKCTAVIRCDGAQWPLTGKVCSAGAAESEFEYRSTEWANELGIKCEFTVDEAFCEDTRDRCLAAY